MHVIQVKEMESTQMVLDLQKVSLKWCNNFIKSSDKKSMPFLILQALLHHEKFSSK